MAEPISASRRSLRIVHTSDVHLMSESASAVDDGAERTKLAFAKVVDQVVDEEADLFLIAGDLFDSNRVTEEIVHFVEIQLRRTPCPVVLIPGNHDCYDGQSIYRRFDFRTCGPHVHPLTAEEGEEISFPELTLTVWGKGLVEHDHAYRPLAHAPRRRNGHWRVGLAHGFVVPDRKVLRSSLITPDEIAESGLDYLALGHVHVFRDVSHGETRACYPGSPSWPSVPGRGSVALISLDPEHGVTLEERRLAKLEVW